MRGQISNFHQVGEDRGGREWACSTIKKCQKKPSAKDQRPLTKKPKSPGPIKITELLVRYTYHHFTLFLFKILWVVSTDWEGVTSGLSQRELHALRVLHALQHAAVCVLHAGCSTLGSGALYSTLGRNPTYNTNLEVYVYIMTLLNTRWPISNFHQVGEDRGETSY